MHMGLRFNCRGGRHPGLRPALEGECGKGLQNRVATVGKAVRHGGRRLQTRCNRSWSWTAAVEASLTDAVGGGRGGRRRLKAQASRAFGVDANNWQPPSCQLAVGKPRRRTAKYRGLGASYAQATVVPRGAVDRHETDPFKYVQADGRGQGC